jgi:CDP-glucose 4,6-dehydratase
MFNNIFENKKVLVTGHTGFKGAWLSLWLTHLKAEVTGISKYIPSHPSLFELLELEKKMKHIVADITNAERMHEIIQEEQPEFIFHLAAQPIVAESYTNPLNTFNTNVIGSANILDALKQYDKPCIVVMITSDKCYENVEWIWGYREHDTLGGKDPYSASKAAAEIVIRSYIESFFKKDSPVKVVTVRAGNVIGGGDWAASRIVPDCVRAWSESKKVTIRNPNSTRPWQHVLEPLSGYLRVAQVMYESDKNNLHGEAFNFGPTADQDFTVLELLKKIVSYSSYGDMTDHFQIEENTHFHEAGLLKLNCDKAKHYLQWLATLDFEQTALFTASWYDCFYNKKYTPEQMLEFTISQIEDYCKKANNKSFAWTY